jgi:hypothetical protein
LVGYNIFVTYLLWLIIGRRIHTRGLVGGLNPKKILHMAPSASGSIPMQRVPVIGDIPACGARWSPGHRPWAGRGAVTVSGCDWPLRSCTSIMMINWCNVSVSFYCTWHGRYMAAQYIEAGLKNN